MGSGSSRLTPNEADKDRAIPDIRVNKPYAVTINFFATLICIGYLLASALYFYVRITYTLFTGGYAWYSIFILAVEFLGISALLPYAFLIVRTVLTKKTPGLPKGDANEPPPPHPWFTVHVLIPCYSESIDVIAATVDAALKADMPPNCVKKVYLCDDGKKQINQNFIHTKRRPNDLLYISGRSRKPGEKNGKSANLNNCLQNHIFSAYKQNGGFGPKAALDIPLSDVVVVFDCDMVCKPNFFLKILEVMADNSLALCLTPQGFTNIDPNIDLFNNLNLQFWEYILPGSVAAGYIACTGTNFCIRARALAYVGWFPEYTITEDYALGMELACNGFKGSYLNEYLAFGEAPDEIRNVMRQRSRWTKGHMEVFFSSRCPLLNFKLSCVNRYLYTNGTWAYFVTVITTPIFLAVPLISLVFGVHPVAVTKEFAVAAVIYFGFTFLLQMYCRNINHTKSLWFAGVSNHVLCFTYVKAIFNTLASKLGCKPAGGFKVTKKKEEKKSALQKALEQMAQKTKTLARSVSRTLSRGKSRGDPNRSTQPILPPPGASAEPEKEDSEEQGCCSWWCANAGDLENTLDSAALFTSFAISAAAMAIGIYQCVNLGYFEVYTTLPIFWAGYNIIPPFLYLWYCFTKGPSFVAMCSVMRLFGVLCGIGAMVSLFFSPMPEINAVDAGNKAGFFLAANQAGVPEMNTDKIAAWVKPSGLFDGAEINVDLSGGFYVDASSNVKYNHPMGIAVSMLAWGFVEFNAGVNRANQMDNYFAFFRHAGSYFSKLWLRSTNEYVTRIGDPEEDGKYLGVPPKDIDAKLDMLRPVFKVAQLPDDNNVYGMDAISSGIAALASAGVALSLSSAPGDDVLSSEYRNMAFLMWNSLIERKGRITGTTYCTDGKKNGTNCMAKPTNSSGCFITYNNTDITDPAPSPPPVFPPPTPIRHFPPGFTGANANAGSLIPGSAVGAPPQGRRLLRNPDSPWPPQPPSPPDSPYPPQPPQPPSPPDSPYPPQPPQPFHCNYSLEYSGDSYFNSTSVYDDAAWAAAWLFRAAELDSTKVKETWSDKADFYLDAHKDMEAAWNNASYYIANYNNMQWPAALLQLQNQKQLKINYKGLGANNMTNTYFRAWFGKLKGMKNMDGYPLSVTDRTKGGLLHTPNASLPNAATTAMMAMQFSKTKENKFARKTLRCWARSQLRYMLGLPERLPNQNIKDMFKPKKGRSFVVGYGKDWPTNVADRAAACPESGITCGIETWNSEIPNPYIVPGALVNGPDLKDQFVNSRTDPSNKVGLLNNMGFNGLVYSFLDPSTSIDGPNCQEDQGVWDKLFNKVEFTD